MEDVGLNDILNIFRGKLFLIIVVTALVTTAGSMYIMFFQTPLFMSESTMVLTAPTSTSSTANSAESITQNDVLLNQKLVSTYSEIIKSRKILSQVISQLKLKYTTEELNSMITVSSKKDTEMLQIMVLNEDAKVSANIADTVAEVFSKEIINIYNIKNVSIIDKAQVSDSPYNVSIIKEIVMFLIIGLVAAFGLSFIIYLFDTTVKDPDEVERKLGIPVLSVIPIYKR